MKKFLLAGVFLPAALSAQAQSAGSTDLSVRVDRLEQRLSSRVFLEMMEKVERLQTELQQIRGDMEHLSHSVDKMTQSQKNLYLDLDKRLLDLESGGIAPAAPANPADTPIFQGNVAPPPASADQPVTLGNTEPGPVPEQGVAGTPAAPPDSSAGRVVDAVEVNSDAGSDASGEAQVYEQAFAMLNNGRYDDAIGGFNRVLSEYPSGKYADNSQYWLGETYYVMRDFDSARNHFNQVIQGYADSRKVPDAMLKLGYIDYEQGKWKTSRKSLQKVVSDYPGTNAARLAERRLNRMKKEGH